MTVAIVRATTETVCASMDELLHLLGYHPRRPALFVKPNVADSAPPGLGLFTDPAVVDALLASLPRLPTVIGEGCIVSRDAGIALRKNGFGAVAERYGAELVDLELTHRQIVRSRSSWDQVPGLNGQLSLPAYLTTHEYINVAKMKTHVQTGVSLGLKNQKGLLLASDKRRFHRLGLNECIRALGEVARPDLTIVDAIVALEGNGPWRYGTPVPMNLLVGGTDLVEVDNVCLELMGFSHEHAPHIPPMQRVSTVGLSVAEARRGFAFGYRGSFVYRNVHEHLNDSCSGCNLSLYRGMRAVKSSPLHRLRFYYRGVWRRLDVVMGHCEDLPPGHGKVICVGDCSRGLALKYGLPLARGCPPAPERVLALF